MIWCAVTLQCYGESAGRSRISGFAVYPSVSQHGVFIPVAPFVSKRRKLESARDEAAAKIWQRDLYSGAGLGIISEERRKVGRLKVETRSTEKRPTLNAQHSTSNVEGENEKES
jgi:hypothetical protein